MPPEKTVHPWLAHLQGLAAILKARNKKTGLCFPGINFFVALDNSLDRSAWAIDHSTSDNSWFIDKSDHDERPPYSRIFTEYPLEPCPFANSQSISASLDDLILQTEPILQMAPSLLKSSHPRAKAKVENILTSARSQLLSFKDWPSRIPDFWHPRIIHYQIEASEISQLDIFAGRLDVYPNCQWLA